MSTIHESHHSAPRRRGTESQSGPDLSHRYGKIGIPAVAAAAPYQSACKTSDKDAALPAPGGDHTVRSKPRRA